jgi:hypothetical protein
MRQRRRRNNGTRRVRRSTGRSSQTLSIFASISVGLCVGGIVMLTGLVSPSGLTTHYRGRTGAFHSQQLSTNIASVHRSSYSSLNGSSQNELSIGQVMHFLPDGLSALALRSGLQDEAVAYQEGRCTASCKASIKSKLASSLGPNWREIVEQYRPMVTSLERQMTNRETSNRGRYTQVR